VNSATAATIDKATVASMPAMLINLDTCGCCSATRLNSASIRPDDTRGGTDKAAPPSFIPANNPIEADHGKLKHRLRPMRGLHSDRTAQVVIAGHAFVQNLRRGHYELGVDASPALRVDAAFTELSQAI
jgi:hypothetical protein